MALGLSVSLAGCATPIQVERADSEAERRVEANVISTGELSEPTRIVLRQQNLSERVQVDPDGAIAQLHQTVAAGGAGTDAVFALAELSYRRTLDTGKPDYALAGAIYAYRFLFPDDPQQRPSAFDPRFRAACVIYNRGLARAFSTADASKVELRAGQFALPFGSIQITYDPSAARWGDLRLSDFTPADSLKVSGLEALYRRPGIGASLAAAASASSQSGLPIEPNVRVPVTALLRMDNLGHDLRQGRLTGTLEVHPAYEPSDLTIAGQTVPLEADTSKAFALSLTDPKVWESEFAGFLNGNLFDRTEAQLVSLEPYRTDQIPVVFIHGTGRAPAAGPT